MPRDIKTYFEQTIIPLIAEQYSDIVAEMSILISGSVGLSIHDEDSDLDAIIYLDDSIWQTQGGELQLMLLHQPPKFTTKNVLHPEICVHPISWLLDGHYQKFLEAKEELPWDKVNLWSLYEIQENLILHDPHHLLHQLRAATKCERFPGWLWQKLLISKLYELLELDELGEFERVVSQDKILEAYIILGRALEGLLQLGFLIDRQYYPYRKHLRWAFEKLPIATRVLADIDTLISSLDWNAKVTSVKAIKETYKAYLHENNVVPAELLEDLSWAFRGEAWLNPRWRDRINKCRQQAIKAGYEASDGWVWSLWGWASN
jgi:hypothetical protein